MGKYRDRIDIVADVLRAASAGSNKTRIMYGANLSYKLLGKYLELTILKGFLHTEGYRYQVTDSGQDFLERYLRYSDQYAKVQGSLKDLEGEQKQLQQLCGEPEEKTQ